MCVGGTVEENIRFEWEKPAKEALANTPSERCDYLNYVLFMDIASGTI